jgi:YHS domain-containing protein
MMNNKFFHRAKSLMLLAAILTIGVVAGVNAQSEKAKDTELTQVETKYVCMINNQRFDKEQIPVTVDGVTYYGCCEMCKEKLQKDKSSHVAVDPVSGKKVDKAKAVIGAAADGKVYYFESVENLKKFKVTSADKKSDAHKHDSHNH